MVVYVSGRKILNIEIIEVETFRRSIKKEKITQDYTGLHRNIKI